MTVFSSTQKHEVADAVQAILHFIHHPALPEGEISFRLYINGTKPGECIDIYNNGAIEKRSVDSCPPPITEED